MLFKHLIFLIILLQTLYSTTYCLKCPVSKLFYKNITNECADCMCMTTLLIKTVDKVENYVKYKPLKYGFTSNFKRFINNFSKYNENTYYYTTTENEENILFLMCNKDNCTTNGKLIKDIIFNKL